MDKKTPTGKAAAPNAALIGGGKVLHQRNLTFHRNNKCTTDIWIAIGGYVETGKDGEDIIYGMKVGAVPNG